MFVQQLINGIVLGATYALFASGFTLVFGILGLINLMYGFYFTVGAFTALSMMQLGHLPIWLAFPVAAFLTGVIAVITDSILLSRVRTSKAPDLSSLMVTLGATLMFYSLMTAWLGTGIRRFPMSTFADSYLEVQGGRISFIQIVIVVASLAVVSALVVLLRATNFGLEMRAVSQNSRAAELMGVNAIKVMILVSFTSGAFGGIAGMLLGLNYNAVQPYMGEGMMLKGFSAIIVGGMGDVRGALFAGLLIGLLETFTAGYISSSLKEAVPFALLVLILWIRPSGLFGRQNAKRA